MRWGGGMATRVWAPSRRTLRRLGGALLGLCLGVGVSIALRAWWATAASSTLMDRYTLRDVKTDQRALALTFDISWGTIMPGKVLAVLVHDHVPATFFLSGPWAAQHPEYVRTLVRDGFEVESHGWAHVNFSRLGYDGVVANIRRADTVLRELTGRPVRFIRPPNGDFNRVSLAAARSLGYTTVTWGTDSWDWMNPGVDTIVRRVVDHAFPGDIVLLHASDTCKQTDIALPVIIRDLRQKGYRLLTLTDLLRLGEPDYRG